MVLEGEEREERKEGSGGGGVFYFILLFFFPFVYISGVRVRSRVILSSHLSGARGFGSEPNCG